MGLASIFTSRRFRSSTSRRKPNRNCLTAAEILEERLLLTADPLAEVTSNDGWSIDPSHYDPTSILVQFHQNASGPIALPDGFADAGMGSDLLPGMRQFYLPDGMSVPDAMALFANNSSVAYTEPNYYVQLLGEPNDTRVDELWGLNNTGQTGGTVDADIDAFEAWDITTGNGSTVIAVIDTGVDWTHPDLAANIWSNPGEIAGDGIDNDGNGFIDDVRGWDFANADNNPMDDHNHGTHVAGTIGAIGNNNEGVVGVNWNATIMPIKFIEASGSGSIAHAVQAIDYAVANGARISNNSWGFNGGFSQILSDAIENAQGAGHIFVGAAGNGDQFGNGLDNDVTPFWPSNHVFDNVVAVAALDHNDDLAGFSNYGATTVDVGAPGVGILSTTIGNTYSTFNGTSMATPHVTGVLSLLMDENPGWDYRQVIDRLYETVDLVSSLDGITTTGGRVNAAAALGPDVTGPRVISSDPSNYLFDPFSTIRLDFSEAIDPATFTTADVLSLTGPNGAIAVTGVNVVPNTFTRQFDITFAQQDTLGDYTLVLGPDIQDLAGNQMDVDRDGVAGETTDDQTSITFSLVPFFLDLDFGINGSPVEPGYNQMTAGTTFNAERGYGWTSGTIDGRDRGASAGNDLERDFSFFTNATISVDVPTAPAIYTVEMTFGDSLATRDQMGIFLEGIQVDSVTVAQGSYVTKTYTTSVADGFLTIDFDDLGGDPTVVINAISIDAIGDDTDGPQIVSSDPVTETYGSFDRFEVTFSEAMDPTSFTTADVTINGPSGTVAATAVNSLSANSFEILFATQVELGNYSFTIGPNVTDVAGNAMDQDADGTAGEATEDRFTSTVELKSVPPFAELFDFGTTSSPLAAGATRVAHNDTYSAATGFGWSSGSIDSRDRGSFYGNDLERDFNFTSVGTFLVDVTPQPAVYDVTVTLGDGLATRDDMGIFLEGALVDTVTANAGQYAVNTYRVTVSDGQLTLTVQDLGGSSNLVMINGVDIVQVGLDSSGPRVVSTTPDTEAAGAMDKITVTFDETVDAATFTAADVSLSGPNGAINITGVNQISPVAFDVTFANQTTVGDYVLNVGPDISDIAGNLMNQDGDANNGEATDDVFNKTIPLVTVPTFEAYFDFGTTGSPIANGYTRVAHNTTYSAGLGHGWTSGSIDSRDRGSYYGDDLERDFNHTALGTFVVDVPAGPAIYTVTVTLGDGLALRDDMGIILEGALVDSVTAAAGQYEVRTYTVTVSDGQLTLTVDDLGGSNGLVMINGLDVVQVGPDSVGPKIVATTPNDTVPGAFDSINVTFDEEIDETTFSTADVTLNGPSGPVTINAVNKLSPIEYEILFDTQTDLGDYTLTVGPDLADVTGNLMNQDGDGINGEATEDRFELTVELVPTPPFSANFDFGTSASPVKTGFTPVYYNSTYTTGQGYGWTSGSIDSRDRGSWYGDELERDFNHLTLGTFVVDVLSHTAEYDVKVTMGDGLALRDDMGVFLEGNLAGSLTAPAGQYAVATFRVTVTDGQLTIDLDDLGGSNGLVMINGIEIVEVQGGNPSIQFGGGNGGQQQPARKNRVGSPSAIGRLNAPSTPRFSVADFRNEYRVSVSQDTTAETGSQFAAQSELASVSYGDSQTTNDVIQRRFDETEREDASERTSEDFDVVFAELAASDEPALLAV